MGLIRDARFFKGGGADGCPKAGKVGSIIFTPWRARPVPLPEF